MTQDISQVKSVAPLKMEDDGKTVSPLYDLPAQLIKDDLGRATAAARGDRDAHGHPFDDRSSEGLLDRRYEQHVAGAENSLGIGALAEEPHMIAESK